MIYECILKSKIDAHKRIPNSTKNLAELLVKIVWYKNKLNTSFQLILLAFL